LYFLQEGLPFRGDEGFGGFPDGISLEGLEVLLDEVLGGLEVAIVKKKHLTQLRRRGQIGWCAYPGNTKGGSIIVLLTSCLTGLESGV